MQLMHERLGLWQLQSRQSLIRPVALQEDKKRREDGYDCSSLQHVHLRRDHHALQR